MKKILKLFLVIALFSFTTCSRFIHGFEYVISKNQLTDPEDAIIKSGCKFKTELVNERYRKALDSENLNLNYSQIYFVNIDESQKLNYAIQYVLFSNDDKTIFKIYAFTSKPSESALTYESDFESKYRVVSDKVIKECFKLTVETPKLIQAEIK